MYVGRGAWAFEVRGRHVGAWRARGETVYRIQRSVLRIQDLETSTHDTAGPRIRNRDATHRDETAASSDGEAGQAFTRTRWLCLRRPRPSPPSARALFQTLAGACQGVGDVELLPVRHGGKEGLTQLHRRRSSLQGLRRCRRGLRDEDGVVSFRSRTLGGVLERRDMIDQELEVDVDAV